MQVYAENGLRSTLARSRALMERSESNARERVSGEKSAEIEADFQGEIGAKKCRLGNNVKFHSALTGIKDLEHSDSLRLDSGKFRVNARSGELEIIPDLGAVRLERYALQSVARAWLPGTAVAKCLRVRRTEQLSVMVRSGEPGKAGSASYNGLCTCSGVWVCPVCAAKISERRRLDLVQGVSSWREGGGSVYFLTLTIPHCYGEDLGALLRAQGRALARLWGSRQGMALWAGIGKQGHVRAYEVTFGDSGFHPHFHILLFLDRSLSAPDRRVVETRIYRVWAVECRKAGLSIPSREHGVKLEDGAIAAAYIGKWGLEHELTKGHIKRARSGLTPWDMLRAGLADPWTEYRYQFLLYVKAFRGLSQLRYSRGLRDLLGLGRELTDKEIAEQADSQAFMFAQLSDAQWRLVLANDCRGELLEVAKWGDFPRFYHFLASLQ